MVEWLAGNRIIGTTAERPALGLPSGSVGGWKEVGRQKLDGNTATIDVSWTPDKRYYMILMDYTQTSDFSGLHQLGNSSIDTGNNYHNRQYTGSGTDSASQATYVRLDNGWQSGDRKFVVEYIADLTNKEKLIINNMARSVTTGASQKPQRSEVVSKWVPSTASDTIGKFKMMNGGTYADNSEVVVLGWDPADTHTDNFWQELANVNLSSAGSTLSSGVFTPKKFMWVQAWAKVSPATGAPTIQVGSGSVDTATNYSTRAKTSVGNNTTSSDDEATSSSIDIAPAFIQNNETFFVNMYIVNNSANEKLIIWDNVQQGGVGTLNATDRRLGVSKWANTSSQIDIVSLINAGSGNFSNGTIKVWGSD